MDRLLLLLLLLLAGVHAIVIPVATARPLGVGASESPSATIGVVTASNGTATEVAAAPSARGMDGGRPDKSIAGAEVILGGFATAVFAIIFCYIRVTRRRAAGGDA